MDWIEQFLDVTEGLCSPDQFKLWAAISAVAGAMERRLWLRTSLGCEYASMYVLLVAPPGVGKTVAINPIREIWQLSGKLYVAPQSVTKASLVDDLFEAKKLQKVKTPPGAPEEIFEYHSMQYPNSEMGNVIFAHDLGLLSFFNEIFDNDKSYRERRRYNNGGKEICIINPQLNLLFGTQPQFLASIFPEEAWGMGTMSRFIMVFSDEETRPDLFGPIIDRAALYKDLAERMKKWLDLQGAFKFTDEAVAVAQKYYKEKLAPIPDHPRLAHYLTRRFRYLMRLTMVSALSRSNELVIEEFDIERARLWLLNAERSMPAIFSCMSAQSDANLIEELHIEGWRLFRERGKVPLPRAWFYGFLSGRVFVEKIPKILETIVIAKLFEDKGEGFYVPLPRMDFGSNIMKQKET